MYPLFLVMAGGAAGSGARYLTGAATVRLLGPGWPWGTLTVNLIGGLLMGALVGWLGRHASDLGAGSGESWRLLLGVGLLGGFTTFSAFSLDVASMIQRSEWVAASGYALASVIGSVAALFLGLALTRSPA